MMISRPCTLDVRQIPKYVKVSLLRYVRCDELYKQVPYEPRERSVIVSSYQAVATKRRGGGAIEGSRSDRQGKRMCPSPKT
jgi:hypothetical protein